MPKRTKSSSSEDAEVPKKSMCSNLAAEMETDGQQQIEDSENQKINTDKIHNYNDLINETCKKENIQILHFGECENLGEALTKVSNFNFEEFQNIFVLMISLQRIDEDADEDFEKTVLSKFTDDRPLLIEIRVKGSISFLLKRRGADFKSINLNTKNLNEKLLKLKMKRYGLVSDSLLLILNNSLLDADFSKVNEYFKDTKIHPKNHAINAGDELCIRLMKLFNVDFSDEIVIFSAIKTSNFGLFLVGVNVFDESKINDDQVGPLLYLNYNSHNVLTAAFESKNEKMVKFLLKFVEKFPYFFTFTLFQKAFDVIIKTEFFEVFEELKNSKFILQSDKLLLKNKTIEDGELQLEEIAKLHQIIINENISEVKNFVKHFVRKFPYVRIGRGKLDVCILEKSIDCKKFDIYAYLWSQKFVSDKPDELDRKINKISQDHQKMIRIEMLKYIVRNPDSYIGIIISNCTFDPQSPKASKEVSEMLLDLKNIYEVKAMIPTIAHANVAINFDFNTKSIRFMVPGIGENTLGMAIHKENQLYIGKNDNKNQQYGTLVHEMTHIVFYLVFENDCLPYCKGDTVREAQWKKIVDDLHAYCKHNKTDPIISRVFNYNSSKWYIEMAVRVNELIAYYRNEPEELKKIKDLHDFKELFNFNRLVLKDLKLQNVYPLIKLNNDFGLIEAIEKSVFKVKGSKNKILNISEEKVTSTSRLILLTSNAPQLLLSNIFQEIQSLPGNKLNLKVRNIFINSKKLDQDQLRKTYEDLIVMAEIDWLIISLENLDPKTFEFLKFLANLTPKFICFCVLNVKNYKPKDNPEEITATFRIRRSIKTLWNDLTDQTIEHIQNRIIKFQGKPLKASNLISFDEELKSPEILAILCSDTEIQVNCNSEVDSQGMFIPRFIKMSKPGVSTNSINTLGDTNNTEPSSSLSVSEFVEKTVKEQGLTNIVLICDSAGSGKTTLLKKMHAIFNEKYQFHWISFISLRNYRNELCGGVGVDFQFFMNKILDLNDFDQKIFAQKFARGEVKILFDGYDEIMHNCLENTLKLLKLFKSYNGNQIFITSRVHLEQDSKKKLNMTTYSLAVLDSSEKVKFLCHIWKNSHADSEFITTSSEALVEKISEIVLTNSNLNGLPIVQNLAEVFKDKINDNFLDEIQSLNISDVYKKIIEKNLKDLSIRFPEDFFENLKKSSSLLHVLQYLAVVFLFDKKQASELGLFHDEDDWPLREIARCGLISYDKNKNSQFNHETCGEFLIAGFIFLLLKNVDDIADPPFNFVVKILSEEKYKTTRMFLDKILEREENIENFKIFESRFKFLGTINESEKFMNILKNSVEEKLINIFEFWDKLIFLGPLSEQPSTELSEQKLQLLSHILPSCQNSIKFEKNLKTFFKFYSSNVYSKFITNGDENGDTFFHHLGWRCTNEKIIEIFWQKVTEQNFTEDEIKSIFFMTNNRGDNLLHTLFYYTKSFNHKNIHNVPKSPKVHTKKIMKIIGIMQKNLTKDEQIKLVLSKNEDGESFMLQSTADSLTFKFTSTLVSDIHFKEILESKYKSGRNVLHSVIINGIPEAFDFYWTKIEEKDQKKFLFCKTTDHVNILQLSAVKNFLFPKIFNLSLSLCQGKEEMESFLCENIYGNHDLILDVAGSNNLDNLKIVFSKLDEVYNREFMTNLLKNKKFKRARLLLFHPLIKNLSTNFLDFIWSTLKKYIAIEEFVEFFSAKDEDGHNLLLTSVFLHKSNENFKLFLEIIKEIFVDEDLQKYLLNKDQQEINILMVAIIKEQEDTFFLLFNNIFLKNFHLKEFIFETNIFGEHIFHLLTRLGTNSMFECVMSAMRWHLSKDEITKLLKFKNKAGHDALLMLKMNDKKRIIFLSFVNEIFTENELKEFALDKLGGHSIPDMLASLSSLRDAFENINKGSMPMNPDTAAKHKEVLEQLGKLKTLLSLTPDLLKNMSEGIHIPMQDLDGLMNKLKQGLSSEDHLKFLNSEDTEGTTMFQRFIIDSEPQGLIQIIWMRIKGLDKKLKKSLLLKKEAKGLNALLLSIIHKNDNLFEFLFKDIYCDTLELQDFIYETENENENLLHKIARFGSHHIVEIAMEKLVDKLSQDEIRKLIVGINKKGENIFHMMAKNNEDDQSVNLMIEFFDKGLECKQIQEMLRLQGNFSCTPLHYAFKLNSLDVANIFVTNYKEYFESAEISQFLIIEESENKQNIVELANERGIEFYNIIENLLNDLG